MACNSVAQKLTNMSKFEYCNTKDHEYSQKQTIQKIAKTNMACSFLARKLAKTNKPEYCEISMACNALVRKLSKNEQARTK